MATLISRRTVARAELERLLQARDDIVRERAEPAAAGGGRSARFGLAHGPFRRYERTVDLDPGDAGPVTVTERFEYEVAAPLWWRTLFHFPLRRALRRAPRLGTQPWWAPPARLDQQASWTLGLVCTLAVVNAYLGTLIGQTITFVADEFDAPDRTQALVLAAARIGALASLVAAVLADRRGRRRLLGWCLIGAILATAVSGLAPTLVTYAVSQTVARGLATASGTLIAVVAVEELAAGSRGYGASLITMAAGLGSGMVLWLLPLADLGTRAWRLQYLVPLLFLPLAWWTLRHLPETRRFTDAARSEQERPSGPTDRLDRRRLALLGTTAFLVLFFLSPVSQFQNEFLRDERGFSAADLTLFGLLTNTPAGLAVFLGGRLSDVRGRRVIAASGLLGAAAFNAVTYNAVGWLVWIAAAGRAAVGGMATPALGVFGPELFGTRSRARANSILTVIGVAGSAAGLLVVGFLSDALGGLGPAFIVVAAAPVIVAVLVLTRFPETSGHELEELNPEDDSPVAPPAPTGRSRPPTAPDGPCGRPRSP